MVYDLINLELNIWRYEDIMAIFHREAMCQIPLSRRNVLDTIFWLHNSRGVFTVKFAYHVARRLLNDENRVGTSRGCAAKMYGLQYGSFGFQTKSNYLDGELAMRFYQ